MVVEVAASVSRVEEADEARRVLLSPAGWEAWESVRGAQPEACAPDSRVIEFRVPPRRARVVPQTGHVTVCSQSNEISPAFPLAHPMGELVMTTLLEGQAIELHAAAVVDGTSGWALAGVSGAGKSTISNLWRQIPPWRRLAEERLLIWPRHGRDRTHPPGLRYSHHSLLR